MSKKTLVFSMLSPLLLSSMASASSADAPWWEQEKIRFFWGQWQRSLNKDWPGAIPWEQMMENLSRVGATVFVSRGQGFRGAPWTPEGFPPVSLAQKYGLRYFGLINVHLNRPLGEKLGCRLAVNKNGRTSLEEKAQGMAFSENFSAYVSCPLDPQLVEEWFLKPVLAMAKSGVVDGCHTDWEAYGGTAYDQMGDYLCYCDDCFGNFLKKKGRSDPIGRSERYRWLQDQRLLREYLMHQRDRLIELYRSVAEQVRQVKPDFIFSAYWGFVPGDLEDSWRLEGTALGLHSPEAPFFVIDAGHYWPNHNMPWWETGYVGLHRLGLKHILGTWTGGMYGEMPAIEVSAPQWMYDAALSHDGYWLWFEHVFGPNDYLNFRAANARIRAVESRVGDLLLKGTQDNSWVCLVEQSGDPDLGRDLIARTYHREGRHLIRVNNVNTDIPVQVQIRIPDLPEDSQWTVTDPFGDLYYTPEGDRASWTAAELQQGLMLAMEKRSEAWLLLSPTASAIRAARSQTVSAAPTGGHPPRPPTSEAPPTGSAAPSGWPLVYANSNRLDFYYGPSSHSINPVTGTGIYLVDGSGNAPNAEPLFSLVGNCWSPQRSPDRTRIAFSAQVNGKGQIYVMNADGSNPYNVSSNDFCDHSPMWSPDGQSLAFVSDREGDWDIYVMQGDGTNPRRLTHSRGTDRSPAWSPDGQWIAFESDRRGDYDIYVVGVDGKGERPLLQKSGNEYQPVWSPDGKRIACTIGVRGSYRDVAVADADTGYMHHPNGLTLAAGKWYSDVGSITWSPDGQWIAGTFESNRATRTGVFVVSRDAAEVRELVVGRLLKPYPGGAPGYQLVGGWYFNGAASRRWLLTTFKEVSWSPDGSRIAFCCDLDESGYFFYYTVSLDGSKLKRLDDTMSPAGPNNQPIPIRGFGDVEGG